jgi:Plasma-membrane choline transporter
MYDYIACTFLVMIVSYMTASIFMEVFHMTVDTIIMCYITDSEQNGGVPICADQSLAAFLAQHGALTADHKRVEEMGGNVGPLHIGLAHPEVSPNLSAIPPTSSEVLPTADYYGRDKNTTPSSLIV